MTCTLEKLYRGEVMPCEVPIKDNCYKQAVKAMCDAEETLRESLKGGDIKLFNAFVFASEEVHAIAGQQRFIQGYRLANKFLIESLTK